MKDENKKYFTLHTSSNTYLTSRINRVPSLTLSVMSAAARSKLFPVPFWLNVYNLPSGAETNT